MFNHPVLAGVVIWLLGICPAPAELVPVWSTGAGTMTMVFQRDLLSALGMTVHGTGAVASSSAAFALTPDSSIKFVSPWGAPDSFLGGSLKCGDGITIEWKQDGETGRADIEQLELFSLKDTGTFEMRDEDSEPVLTIDEFDVAFDPGLHSLSLRRGSLRIGAQFATRIARPSLAGLVIGVVDCEVEIHELQNRINRHPRPLPALCSVPAGTNSGVRIASLDAMQMAGTNENGAIAAAVSFSLENPGPDSRKLSDLTDTPLALRLLAVENGTTQTVARADRTLRVDQSGRCTCADTTLLYPGLTSRWTVADAIASDMMLDIPSETLSRENATLIIEVEIPGSIISRSCRPHRVCDAWLFDLR